MQEQNRRLQRLSKELLARNEFLEDELRRCYKDLEDDEVEIEKLKAENQELLKAKIGLISALEKSVWGNMRSRALKRCQGRKWRART